MRWKSATRATEEFAELCREHSKLMADTRHASGSPGWVEAWLDRLEALTERAHSSGYGLDDVAEAARAGRPGDTGEPSTSS